MITLALAALLAALPCDQGPRMRVLTSYICACDGFEPRAPWIRPWLCCSAFCERKQVEYWTDRPGTECCGVYLGGTVEP